MEWLRNTWLIIPALKVEIYGLPGFVNIRYYLVDIITSILGASKFEK